MRQEEETDHFLILEEKIERLIQYVKSLKKEKKDLNQRIEILANEVEHLKTTRDKGKQKMISLLEKIDQLDS